MNLIKEKQKKYKVVKEERLLTECCRECINKDLLHDEIVNINKPDILNNLLPVCTKCNKPFSKATIIKVISEDELIKRCNMICCYCGIKSQKNISNCVYHSTCDACKNNKGTECKICKTFEYKYLGVNCCNCEETTDLMLTQALVCSHRICKSCYKGKGIITCKICNQERTALHVRVKLIIDM